VSVFVLLQRPCTVLHGVEWYKRLSQVLLGAIKYLHCCRLTQCVQYEKLQKYEAVIQDQIIRAYV